ncbi:MAG: hypothetical protein KAH01_04140 [Caldisericia bacterium]|nr:hypothetical protein [Caldisericia bacterium]
MKTEEEILEHRNMLAKIDRDGTSGHDGDGPGLDTLNWVLEVTGNKHIETKEKK